MDYDFKTVDTKLKAAEDWLQKEYRSLRTGRAAPAILDSVQVSAYGSMVALKATATIGMDDTRTLRVQPFDPAIAKDIERAISAANLGVGTASDGNVIRVSFPELTGERRDQLIKVAKGKLEEARTSVRMARDESWKEIQERERDGTLTEDDKFSLKDELQKRVDKANETLEGFFESKEKEMSN